MPRRAPEHRLEQLVDAATEIFVERGYRLTQMSDVANAIGVAKGTIYGYVESKEALFALCLGYADRAGLMERPTELPFPTPKRGDLSAYLQEVLKRENIGPHLARALEQEHVDDPRAELEAIARELYERLETFRKAIKLVDRCVDHPELRETWLVLGRQAPREAMARYLELRVRSGQLRPLANIRLGARLLQEVAVTWAIHIHWDRNPERFDPDEARENAIAFIVNAFSLP